MFYIFFGIAIYSLINPLIQALFARAFDISIREITIGSGPVLFSCWKVKFKPVWIYSSISMCDTRSDLLPGEDIRNAYDQKYLFVQFLLPISGSLAILLAIILINNNAASIVFSGMHQVISGTLFPFSSGQDLINGMKHFISSNPPINIIIYSILKMMSINLLPLTCLFGGSSIYSLLRKIDYFERKEIIYLKISVFLYMLMMLSWLSAIVYFIAK